MECPFYGKFRKLKWTLQDNFFKIIVSREGIIIPIAYLLPSYWVIHPFLGQREGKDLDKLHNTTFYKWFSKCGTIDN